MKHPYIFHLYDEPITIVGAGLLTLVGASRADAKRHIPLLVDASAMEHRTGSKKIVTAYNGDLADEIHEFANAALGGTKLKRLMFKEGTVVEVTAGR